MLFQTTKNPIPQNYGAFNANHGNRNNGDTTSQRESLNHGLIGDNISEVIPFETEIAITTEDRNVPGVKILNSSNDLFSVPIEYMCDNNPPMPTKNSREKPRDLGKKHSTHEGAKGTWKKVEKQKKSVTLNLTQPTINSSKKRTLREDTDISKGSISSTKRAKILEVTHNDLCSMAEATDQPRRAQ